MYVSSLQSRKVGNPRRFATVVLRLMAYWSAHRNLHAKSDSSMFPCHTKPVRRLGFDASVSVTTKLIELKNPTLTPLLMQAMFSQVQTLFFSSKSGSAAWYGLFPAWSWNSLAASVALLMRKQTSV